MKPSHPGFELMLRKFESRAPLDDEDRRALLSLPFRIQTLEPASYVVREGEHPNRSCLILSGLAFRHKVTLDGARQIVGVSDIDRAVALAGDDVDSEPLVHGSHP